jgi:hypothetical protein
MTEEERNRVREAFLAAAESPVADKCLQDTDIRIADLFRKLADDPRQMQIFEGEIAEGKTTVDSIVRQLQQKFPPAP